MQVKNTVGLTLIELLIALMVTGIMTAIAVPRFSGLIKKPYIHECGKGDLVRSTQSRDDGYQAR
jgi:prepilin-type N-terminal cleavage/methylation domain-containing protein